MARKIRSQQIEGGKRIKAPEQIPLDTSDKQPPIFCLRYLAKGFCVSDCNQKEKAAFADTLRKLSQQTWEQLRQSPRHGLGYEKIRREAVCAPIPSYVTEDVNIIAFRFYGKASMAGYRVYRVFHIVWVDPKLKLYAH